jgi:hypothetical protein
MTLALSFEGNHRLSFPELSSLTWNSSLATVLVRSRSCIDRDCRVMIAVGIDRNVVSYGSSCCTALYSYPLLVGVFEVTGLAWPFWVLAMNAGPIYSPFQYLVNEHQNNNSLPQRVVGIFIPSMHSLPMENAGLCCCFGFLSIRLGCVVLLSRLLPRKIVVVLRAAVLFCDLAYEFSDSLKG